MEARGWRLKALACEVLARQVYNAAARSPQVVDVELLERGLHDSAPALRSELQRRIDAVSPERYDGIVLVYGLCNRATDGLVTRQVPLALVRAHDCITLYLGSRERYTAEFEAQPGTYYYSAEWLERASKTAPGGPDQGLAYGTRLPADYAELVRKYGEENAQYLVEVYGGWHQHYSRAAYIRLPCSQCAAGQAVACAHDAPFRGRAAAAATQHGWQFVELAGEPHLLQRLIDADWARGPDADILVVPPGHAIAATYDDRVVDAVPATGG